MKSIHPIFWDRFFGEKNQTLGKIWRNIFPHTGDKKIFALKPMNCPGQKIFKNGLKSYRDLPIKYAKFWKSHDRTIGIRG
ncbi:MAG: hypothetical protein CM15mP111_4620 [Hyphomicrobiales bacterium]|nr:MAG: hypothetical protein CM15mP111_4620 [Hyphomicrobiales bacterium]